MQKIPDNISHERLLTALESHERELEPQMSIYYTQLRHRLLTLARKARLEVAVYELTGMAPAELYQKTSHELMALLDARRGGSGSGGFEPFRRW